MSFCLGTYPKSRKTPGVAGAIHMIAKTTGKPVRYCGRLFTMEEMEWIRRLLVSEPKLNRAQLSRRVCRET